MTTKQTNELRNYLKELDIHDLCQLIREAIDILCTSLRKDHGFGRYIHVYGTIDTIWPKIILIYKSKDASCEFEGAKTFVI